MLNCIFLVTTGQAPQCPQSPFRLGLHGETPLSSKESIFPRMFIKQGLALTEASWSFPPASTGFF